MTVNLTFLQNAFIHIPFRMELL